MGKSTLLDAFAELAGKRKIKVIRFDCRLIEPTVRGFLHDLGTALGVENHSLKKVAGQLGKSSRRVVIVLDHYEAFRLLDTWLRQVFIPALGHNIRVLLAGREPPSTAWTIAREWHGLFHSLMLAPLSHADSMQLLRQAGVSKEDSADMYLSAVCCAPPRLTTPRTLPFRSEMFLNSGRATSQKSGR